VGYSNAFSFNDPQGMCPECNGIGRKIGVDLDKFLDKSKSLNDGAILYPEYAVESWGGTSTQSGLFDNGKKLDDYSEEEMNLLLTANPTKSRWTLAANLST
jgi:excinuclease UvrABC ATPase subunit